MNIGCVVFFYKIKHLVNLTHKPKSMGSKISLLKSDSLVHSEYFRGWKPDNFQWFPNNQKAFESVQYDEDFFRSMYNRAPKPEEDVEGLSKAGVVLNFVFGLSTPPSNMTPRECELIRESSQILRESNKSIGFGLSMTLSRIAQANPQCVKCWKSRSVGHEYE